MLLGRIDQVGKRIRSVGSVHFKTDLSSKGNPPLPLDVLGLSFADYPLVMFLELASFQTSCTAA